MKNQTTISSQAKLKLYQEKLKQLELIELPKAKQRVGEAVFSGDWHENAEYEDAVIQQELIEAKIVQLKKLIKTLGNLTQK